MTPAVQRTVLKIEGPPGSGKSRELARETCRLIVQDGISPEQILLLAISKQNEKTLRYFLKKEAKLAGLSESICTIQTLDDFLLGLLPNKMFLLESETALILLYGLMQQLPELPESLAKQQSLTQAVLNLFQTLQAKNITQDQLKPQHSWLNQLYTQWLQSIARLQLITPAQLISRLQNVDTTQNQYKVILADEVQEWSTIHHQLFAKLPVNLVLAGHSALSIHSDRNADPQTFETLSAYPDHQITFLPKLVCMRDSEPVLSLLNHLLPSPIWEEHSVDAERLKTFVKFGYHRDPQEEANTLALQLKKWVENTQVKERAARWNDCVVLLRSARYQPYLTNAFLEHNIPFYSDALSESVLQLQHGLFDLLSIFEGLQTLKNAPSSLKTATDIQQINRHTRRWLEWMLRDETITINWADYNADTLLIFDLLQHETTPSSAIKVAQKLHHWHQDYEEKSNLPALLSTLESEWLSDFESDEQLSRTWAYLKEKLEHWETQHQRALSNTFQISEVLANYALLWKLPSENKDPEPKVRLLSFHAAQGQEAAFVAIPFMVADEFPQTRHSVELISDTTAESLGLNLKTTTETEVRLLATGISRATDCLWLSTHQTDTGDRETPVLPSPFFITLLNAKRKLLGKPTSFKICSCEQNQCDLDHCGFSKNTKSDDETFFARYTGESSWANLNTQDEEALFEEDEVLTLSASSIHTYMTCPRQFYYKHLLKIKPPDTQAAQLGTMIHRVMEVFNQQAQEKAYTSDRLKQLAVYLFQFSENPEAFLSAGFKPRDKKNLETLNSLALEDLKERLFAAIEDLNQKGYFETYASAKAIHAERRLEFFAIDGIDRCRFTGSLDAIIQREDNTWDILDYKTYQSAYSTGLATCNKHFSATLDALDDNPELSAAERFGARLNLSYPKDYQLPLYYLACQQLPEYQDKIRAIALQMIRPEFPGNPEQGAIRLELPSAEIEAVKDQLIDDMNQYIVEPIVSASFFNAEPVHGCDYCPYASICDDSVSEESEAE